MHVRHSVLPFALFSESATSQNNVLIPPYDQRNFEKGLDIAMSLKSGRLDGFSTQHAASLPYYLLHIFIFYTVSLTKAAQHLKAEI
eukprot:scaffold4488_cov101-Skeletonema_dohrnii-CCMP3373.AAC.6